MNHHTQILIIQRKPPPKSTSKLPRGKGKGPNILATTFSPPQKSKIRIHMLACGQRHLSAETKLQSTNIPRIATPLSPHPGTEVSRKAFQGVASKHTWWCLAYHQASRPKCGCGKYQHLFFAWKCVVIPSIQTIRNKKFKLIKKKKQQQVELISLIGSGFAIIPRRLVNWFMKRVVSLLRLIVLAVLSLRHAGMVTRVISIGFR